MTCPEAADALDMKLKRVEKRLTEARRRLMAMPEVIALWDDLKNGTVQAEDRWGGTRGSKR